MEIVDAFDVGRWDLRDLSLETAREQIAGLSFDQVSIAPSIQVNDNKAFVYATPKHPLMYGVNLPLIGTVFGIDRGFYQEHKNEIDDLVEMACLNSKSSFLILGKDFINDRFLKALASNPNLKKVQLGNLDSGYVLTVHDYEILYNSNIKSIETETVVPELEGIYGKKIYYNDRKTILDGLNYEKANRTDTLVFTKPISDEEIDYLQYVPNIKMVSFYKCTDFASFLKVIDRFESLGKRPEYKIRAQESDNYDYKNEFNKVIFNHLKYLNNDRIKVVVGINEEYSLKDYVKYEKQLVEMIKPALNLSPFEKYLYAYNIVKKFKKYKENHENKDESRQLYKVLEGEYMVCAGFATLLADLLNKLGLGCSELSVAVNVGHDGIDLDTLDIPDGVQTRVGNHARIMVNIVDPKYGIDGIYFADPTWDNDMENDSYNYAFLTPDEYNTILRENYLSFFYLEEIFFVHSKEELNEKVNVRIGKNIREKETGLFKNVVEFYATFRRNLADYMNELEKIDSKKAEYFRTNFANVFRAQQPPSNLKAFMVRLCAVNDELKDENLDDIIWRLKNPYDSCFSFMKKIKNQPALICGNFLKRVIQLFKELDLEFGEMLLNKYPEGKEIEPMVNDERFSLFMEDIGEYILNKVNKGIKGPIIRDAIREVYRVSSTLDDEELEAKLDEVMAYNAAKAKISFPVKYKILQDGTKVPLFEESDKFDCDRSKEFRI